MKSRTLSAAAAVLLLAGCKSLVVSDENGEAKGIPFLTKVPDRILTSTYTQVEWIQVSATVTFGEGKDAKTESVLPTPVSLRDTEANRTKILTLMTAVDAAPSTPDATKAFVNWARPILDATVEPLDKTKATLESNVRGVEMVVSPDRFYLQPKMPLMGSSTHTYKLASDGTLTDATATAEDTTASTLLGMLPVSSYLTKRWVGKTDDSSNAKSTFQASNPRLLLNFNEARAGKPSVTSSFTLKVEEVPITYVVRARCVYKAECELPAKVDLAAALKGLDSSLEIVSTTRGGAAPKKDKEDDTPSYGISGKITLPKAD
jgi:hypothetical protein